MGLLFNFKNKKDLVVLSEDPDEKKEDFMFQIIKDEDEEESEPSDTNKEE